MPKLKTFLIFGLLCSLLVCLAQINAAETKTLQGLVVGVHDGDTLTLLTSDKTQVKIRLDGIDAPELNQEFGEKAKSALSGLVFGKQISAIVSGKDRYHRVLARIIHGKVDVNLRMIGAGFAWRYDKYSQDGLFLKAQNEAKVSRLGLWAGKEPIPPWIWRSRKK